MEIRQKLKIIFFQKQTFLNPFDAKNAFAVFFRDLNVNCGFFQKLSHQIGVLTTVVGMA